MGLNGICWDLIVILWYIRDWTIVIWEYTLWYSDWTWLAEKSYCTFSSLIFPAVNLPFYWSVLCVCWFKNLWHDDRILLVDPFWPKSLDAWWCWVEVRSTVVAVDVIKCSGLIKSFHFLSIGFPSAPWVDGSWFVFRAPNWMASSKTGTI